MSKLWYKKDNKSRQYARSLESMSVPSDCIPSTLLNYTKYWLGKVNRGGLFTVNDETFMLFVSIEKSVQALLPTHMVTQTSKLSNLVNKVVQNCNVQLYWSLLALDLPSEDEYELLRCMVELWITIRGFSIASSWLESYKEVTKSTLQKSTGLRKHLS